MSRKFIKIFLIVTILYSLVYVISGCVEEPTISPIERPYSSVRIGNFAYNADTIDVAITNPDSSVTVKSNLMINTLTDYFDLPSGKRRIVVTNTNSHQVLLDKLIEFSAYEECSLFFVGYFSTSNLFNTFTPVKYFEGDTYIEESPESGQALIKWLNLSGDSKDSTAKKYIIHVRMTNPGNIAKDSATLFASFSRTGFAYNPLEFGSSLATVSSVQRKYHDTLVINGNTHFALVNSAGKHNDTLSTYNTIINPGYIYYFYITGEPIDKTTIKVFEQKQLPLPARPK